MKSVAYWSGYLVPFLLVVSFILYGMATAYSILGVFRAAFYLAAVFGCLLVLSSLVRQATVLESPTLLYVSLFYMFMSLVLILIALIMAAANSAITSVPIVPEFVVLGLLGSSCISILVIGLVMWWAGKHGELSMPVKAGPLAPIFYKRKGSDYDY